MRSRDRPVIVSFVAVLACMAVLQGSASADGTVSGHATYADDGSAAANVEVDFQPDPLPTSGSFPSRETYVHGDGSWSYALPAGNWSVFFVVVGADGSRRSDARRSFTVGDGQTTAFDTQISGAHGAYAATPGTVSGRITNGGVGVPHLRVGFTPDPGVQPSARNSASTDANGAYSLTLPGGGYTVDVADGDLVDGQAPTPTGRVVVPSDGSTAFDYDVPPFAVTPGSVPHDGERDVAYLNAERTRWGLPGAVGYNATWSQACASHNGYLALHKTLQHPEGGAGTTPGGAWAGTHAVLSLGSRWTAAANPWEDAPIHLVQLLTPEMQSMGVDESGGYACATTFPGIRSVAPPGTVWTYPGDGTTGFPPAENASESPFVPGKFVGIPEGTTAGRELFVYRSGDADASCSGFCHAGAPDVVSASLVGPGGPVEVRSMDGSSEIGGYLTGAILIPVKPLAPNATYHASVTLGEDQTFGRSLPQVTKTWSFTTGAANPDGRWPAASSAGSVAPRRPSGTARVTLLRVTPRVVTGARRRTVHHRGALVYWTDAGPSSTRFRVLARKGRRLSRVLAFTHQDRRGRNKAQFEVRRHGKPLRAGRYVLEATPRLDGVTGRTVRTSFRVAAR